MNLVRLVPEQDIAFDQGDEVRAWRARALNILLVALVIGATPMLGLLIYDAIQDPNRWSAISIYLLMYLSTLGLAIFRRLDLRVRAWGLVMEIYAAGALAFVGLGGDGRLYLVVAPVAALILIGARAGLAAAVSSVLTFVALAAVTQRGWIDLQDNPFRLKVWLYEGVVLVTALGMLIFLQQRFHHFLTGLASDRKRFRKAVRRSEQKAQALMDAITEAAMLLDPQGHIIALNAAAANALGGDREELNGAPVFDFLPLEVAVRRNAKFKEVIRRGQPLQFEDQRKGRWYHHSLYPVLNARGEVVQIAIFASDVTERKRAEDWAARASRLAAMGQMATALAHEINNPLQAIQSNLELVLDFDLEPDERSQRLSLVRDEIKHLGEINRRVLGHASPPAETRFPVAVDGLVQRALALLGDQLQDADIAVTTDLPPDLPKTFVAPDQIMQVLINLIINGTEAMSEGGHLDITASADDGMVALTLTNDGTPIPEQHLDQVFEPFFTTKPDGAGLGLAISREIVRQHSGSITARNLLDGGGVVFELKLPTSQAADEREESA